MFSSNKQKGNGKFNFNPTESISTVAGSMRITGDMEAEHDMRIDGKVVGNIYCKAKVVLGPTGNVEGDLHANVADIFGTVSGNISTKELLCLKSKSTVNGNLSVGSLDIEPEAEFNGKCTMVHEPITSNSKVTNSPKVLELEEEVDA